MPLFFTHNYLLHHIRLTCVYLFQSHSCPTHNIFLCSIKFIPRFLIATLLPNLSKSCLSLLYSRSTLSSNKSHTLLYAPWYLNIVLISLPYSCLYIFLFSPISFLLSSHLSLLISISSVEHPPLTFIFLSPTLHLTLTYLCIFSAFFFLKNH